MGKDKIFNAIPDKPLLDGKITIEIYSRKDKTMKKIAIFGKPGSGKSTLSKKLSAQLAIPLHPLDSIIYNANGETVDREIYDCEHNKILASESWILDGFGPIDSFYQRLECADTLIYIDLPYPLSYWLVTKRLLKGLIVKPEGWPDGSSVLKGSMQSYKMLQLSPKFWNPDFSQRLTTYAEGKNLYIIRSITELNRFTRQTIHEEKNTYETDNLG
ncbi:Topology modulation protein [uncultured Thiomicrorhabdus sp.]